MKDGNKKQHGIVKRDKKTAKNHKPCFCVPAIALRDEIIMSVTGTT